MKAQFFSPKGFEIVEDRLIVSDRIAIAVFLIANIILGPLYLFWGSPGTLSTFEEVVGYITAVIWFVGRTIWFAATGRIR